MMVRGNVHKGEIKMNKIKTIGLLAIFVLLLVPTAMAVEQYGTEEECLEAGGTWTNVWKVVGNYQSVGPWHCEYNEPEVFLPGK